MEQRRAARDRRRKLDETKEARREKAWYEPPYLTLEQIAAIVAASERAAAAKKSPLIQRAMAQRDGTCFLLMFYCALRNSEAAGLDMDDYDPRRQRLWVERSKGSNSQNYRLSAECIASLEKWISWRRKVGIQSGVLFTSRSSTRGGRLAPDNIAARFKHWAGVANVKLPRGKSGHLLRHSCGMYLASRLQAPLEDAQRWLGHRSHRSTLIYYHYDDAAMEALAKRIMASADKLSIKLYA